MQRFVGWMKKNGIEYSDGLDFQVGEQVVSGTGVKALRDLNEGELIATIPKQACLTILTTGAAEALDAAELAGGLGLAVAIMHERSKGKNSPWFRYFDILPHQELVPILWSDTEVDTLLTGTELYKVIKEDKQLMKEDWEENVVPLSTIDPFEFPAEFFTLECFLAAKSIVSSRAFEIDGYHGHGLVPLADLFNHKTAAEDVHFMSNCSDSDDDENSESEEEVRVEQKSSSEILEMMLVNNVAAGCEIFNTYGQLSNAALLHRYGFTEPSNPFDIVNIDMECVEEVLLSSFKQVHVRKRRIAWETAGFAGCETEGCLYFEIDANGKPQVELLLLLFLMHTKAYRNLATFAPKVVGDVKKAAKALGWRHDVLPHPKKQKLCKSEPHFTKLERWLLNPAVIHLLELLLAKRDEQYGNSAEDDQRRLHSVSCCEDPKAFHAVSLRLAERRILQNCKHAIQNLEAVGGQ